MCLKYAELKVAEKDITCYKIYLEFEDKRLVSPYRRKIAPELGVLTSTELGKADIYGIVKLGFHSFSKFKDAVKERLGWESNYMPLIAECTNPRNSMYYKG